MTKLHKKVKIREKLTRLMEIQKRKRRKKGKMKRKCGGLLILLELKTIVVIQNSKKVKDY